MDFTVYPDTDYNSYIDSTDADDYFSMRLNSDVWTSDKAEAALFTAFGDLALLPNLDADPSVAVELKALQQAQMEQALHLLATPENRAALEQVNLGGLLSIKVQSDSPVPTRFSARALEILSPYMTQGRTIARTR